MVLSVLKPRKKIKKKIVLQKTFLQSHNKYLYNNLCKHLLCFNRYYKIKLIIFLNAFDTTQAITMLKAIF